MSIRNIPSDTDSIEVEQNNRTVNIPRRMSTHDVDVEPHGFTDTEFSIDRVYEYSGFLQFDAWVSHDTVLNGVLKIGAWVVTREEGLNPHAAGDPPGETLWRNDKQTRDCADCERKVIERKVSNIRNLHAIEHVGGDARLTVAQRFAPPRSNSALPNEEIALIEWTDDEWTVTFVEADSNGDWVNPRDPDETFENRAEAVEHAAEALKTEADN